MKNRFIKYIATVALVMTSLSCKDFVDVVPDNIAVIEDAFETRDSAERFLATLYGYMPDLASINNPAHSAGDEIVVNANRSRNWPGHIIGRGGQTRVQPHLGYWGSTSNNRANAVRNMFIALRDCNIFLENVHLPFDLEPYEQARWIAEAKFLKAYYHFWLMRMYGPIPIVRTNIGVGETDAVRVKREPVDDVVNYIVELLDEALAEPELPLIIADGAEDGRITKLGISAIKARVLVTAASPMFNGNPDYANFTDKDGTNLFSTSVDDDKWVKAATACKEAIEMAEGVGKELFSFDKHDNPQPGWSDSTILKLTIRGSITEPWNPELLWGSTSERVTTGFQSWCQAKVHPQLTAEVRQSTQSFWGPPINLTDMFYSENGVPIDEDVNYDYVNRFGTAVGDSDHRYHIKEGFETGKLNFHREPRFYASLGFDGSLWEGHGVDVDEDSYVVEAKSGQRGGIQDADRYVAAGYFAKKLVEYEAFQSHSVSRFTAEQYPYPVIRLAGLYLLYAEALNETGDLVTAQTYVDRVRSRAGLDGVVQAWSDHSSQPAKPTSKDGLRQIIHQERMIELVFEGQRFWDLRRWKRAEEFLNGPILGWNIIGDDTESYYNVVSLGNYQFFGRDYLWPISENDIITNNNLVQNPGW